MTDSFPSTSPSPTRQMKVVRLTAEHLPQALALSQAVRWPYRIEDWQVAFRLGQGFAVEQDGELVATALWWAYEPDFASTGMIIVADKAQRQGIGSRLLDAILSDAAGRKIILNSTVEGEALYRKGGFVPYDTVLQYQGVLSQAPITEAVIPLRAPTLEDRNAVLAVDRAGTGMGRAKLLDVLCEGDSSMLVVDRGDHISGYALVRRWGRGVVIGPVVARDAADARALVATLAARHVGTFVRIDVTESCEIGPWVETLGLPQVGQVVSMALGKPAQPVPGTAMFALANQSLG